MAKLKLSGKDLRAIGYPEGPVISLTMNLMEKNYKHADKEEVMNILKNVLASPVEYTGDAVLALIAAQLLPKENREGARIQMNEKGIYFNVFGADQIEESAMHQMFQAAKLPIAIAGALMPDAHAGYGLPIGGVLATENAIIPYGVGVDIGCRMKMTVLDIPARDLEQKQDRLTRAIEAETRFGVGATFKQRREHNVLDADWSVSPITKQNKDRAWSQLGTSGSGNHFVEFGLFTAHSKINDLEPGTYVALLSHSGSRGTGAAVCDHYSRIAFSQFPDLSNELKRLAWLSLDSREGNEYWAAMELMGLYATANHSCIHRHIAE